MAIRFDSSSDFLTKSSVSVTDFTFTCWFRPAVVGYGAVFCLENFGSNIMFVGYDPTGKTYIQGPHGGSQLGSAGEIVAGNWYGLTFRRDTADAPDSFVARFYSQAAAIIATRSVATDTAIGTRILLGIESNGSRLDGRLAAYKMWNAVLTQSETEQELLSYRPWRTANLYQEVHGFNADWDTVDLSGNGNTFTRNGTLTYEDGPPILYGAVARNVSSRPAAAPPAPPPPVAGKKLLAALGAGS